VPQAQGEDRQERSGCTGKSRDQSKSSGGNAKTQHQVASPRVGIIKYIKGKISRDNIKGQHLETALKGQHQRTALQENIKHLLD
jgi:hypothetical protein